jgi:predicted dehydrogenase
MFRNNPAVQFCLRAVREGWLGKIFEIDAVMSRCDGRDYRDWLSGFGGGALYIFGGHLIDLVISMLGRPERVTPYSRQTRPELDTLRDNGMAVLEYERATAVVRTTVVEVEGFLRRQLVVCGTGGTIEIYPIEPFNQPQPAPPKLRMALAGPRGEYEAGYQDVVFPPMPGRYDEQLIEFADIVSGRIENPYGYDHELLLHECTLRACGYPLDEAKEIGR